MSCTGTAVCVMQVCEEADVFEVSGLSMLARPLLSSCSNQARSSRCICGNSSRPEMAERPARQAGRG